MDKWRDHYYAAQDIGFYFASSDRDLIDKVSSIMKRNGHVSFSDSMGREHYLLDGRSGVPTLTRNIDGVTKRLVDKNKDDYEQMRPYFFSAIDCILEQSRLPSQLKGYRYIKFILNRLIEDDSLVSPISKTVYPSLCELYKCTPFQIERDIRYAILKSNFTTSKLSPKAFICKLLEYANKLAYEMKNKEYNHANEMVSDISQDNINPYLANIKSFPTTVDYSRFMHLKESTMDNPK